MAELPDPSALTVPQDAPSVDLSPIANAVTALPAPAPLPVATPTGPQAKSGVRIPAVAPDGTYETIDADDRQAAEADGYRFPSAEEVAARKYGTIGQEAIGLGEETLGAATADLSKRAEVGLGLTTPEAIAGREEALGPLGRFAASGLGFGALYALTGGLGVGAEGAGWLSEALGSRALAGAASMAAYGAGQSINDQMIGNAPFNAEAVLMQAGLGAVLGGASEGLVGMVQGAAPDALTAGQRALSGVDGATQRLITKALVAGGADESVVADGLKMAQQAADAGMPLPEFLKVQGEKAGTEAADFAANLDGRTRDMMYGADGEAGFTKDRYAAVARALQGQPIEAALRGGEDFLAGIKENIAEADANPNAYGYRPIDDMGTAIRARAILADAGQAPGDAAGRIAELLSISGVSEDSRVFGAAKGVADMLLSPKAPADVLARAARAFDRGIGWSSARSSIVRRAVSLADDFGAGLRDLRARFEAATAQGSRSMAPTAEEVWKLGDKFREDAQSAVRDWGKESAGAYGDATEFGKRVSGIAADFTKNDQVFGPNIHASWSIPQAAFARNLEARDALLKAMGVTEGGERVISAQRFRAFLKELAADRTGAGTTKGRIFDEWMDSNRELYDAVEKAYQTMPSNANAPSRATLESVLRQANEAKADALQKLGLGEAIGRMKGGSLNLGGWWLPAYIARQFGVPTPLVPFVVGAYKLGKMVFRPRATMEAYGQLARMVAKVNGKIGLTAAQAAKALTAADYGMEGSLGGAFHDRLENSLRKSLLGGSKAASLQDGSQRHGDELAMVSDPEVLGARLARGSSMMPPDTADAMISAAANQVKLRKSIQPAPQAGVGKRGVSEADAVKHGWLLDAVDNPLGPLEDLRDGSHHPDRTAVARAGSPAIMQEADSALLNELAKRDMGQMNPYAHAALQSYLGNASPWPEGLAEAAQASYGAPAAQGSPGLPGGATSGGVKREGQVKKFKSDLARQEKLPIDREWKPA